MSDVVVLTVGGKKYSGWQNISVTRGIEQISGAFELTVTERWPNQPEAREINAGDKCTVSIGTDTVISGYVDDVTSEFDANSHSVSISGRDKTADVVDCSAIHATGQWADRTLQQIASDLVAPFGVSITVDTDTGGKFKSFALAQGETAFEALERAARMRGVLLVSDAAGGIVLSRAGTEKINTPLVQGQNILSGRAPRSMKDRYYQYLVKGENQGRDNTSPAQNTQTKAQATDPAVRQCRVLILLAEDQGDASKMKQRAIWEASVRMGRSCAATVRVQGWKHADGLWTPNTLVYTDAPYLGIQTDMLISSVNYTMGDDDGTLTSLALSKPEAFTVEPLKTEEEST